MEIKVSLALETALEFISEVATCKNEEYNRKRRLALSFISSIEEKLSDIDKEKLINAYNAIVTIKESIIRHKKVEG